MTAAQIDPRWTKTLQEVTDPGLTVHNRPPANPDDVTRLSRTMVETRVSNTIPGDAGTSTRQMSASEQTDAARKASTVRAKAQADGVLGQDFFSFNDLLGKG